MHHAGLASRVARPVHEAPISCICIDSMGKKVGSGWRDSEWDILRVGTDFRARHGTCMILGMIIIIMIIIITVV